MHLSPRTMPTVGVTVAASLALAFLPAGTAAAAPATWRAAAHPVTTQVHAKRSDGHSTVVTPVDRSGRSLATSRQAPAPANRRTLRARALSGTPLSTWHVIFDAGFQANQPAMDAFNRAVATWSRAVTSTQVITVNAKLATFADPTLLGDTTTTFFTPPAPDDFLYFPVALANSLAGSDLDPGAAGTGAGQGNDDPAHADIDSTFSSDPNVFDFDAGTTDITTKVCTPAPGVNDPSPAPTAGACMDFESIVLHELGHGLGFLGSVAEDPNGTTASFGFNPNGTGGGPVDKRPYVFDEFTETADGSGILDYPNGSTDLHDAITSNGVYWYGPEGAAADSGREPELWAPSTYTAASSYSHLDDEAYPSGDADALMTPYSEGGDITRDPGEVTLGMLRDMGWVTPGLPGSRYTPVTPARVLDSGSTKVPNGGVRDVSLTARVPRTATAVVLNLTTSQPASTNTVRAYPLPRFDGAPIPSAASLVTYVKDDRSDLVTVPLSSGGPPSRGLHVRVRNDGGAARLIADIVGYYAPDGQLYFHPMTQKRFADSRTGTGLARRRLGAGQVEDLAVAGRGGVPTNATAAVLTVTAIKPSLHTYVTAYTPGGSTVGWTVNLNANTVEANQGIVKLNAGKVRLRNYRGTTDLVVEVAGWYDTDPVGGTTFRNVLAQRLDTGAAKLGAGGTKNVLVADGTFGAPSTAKAVVVNLMGIGPSAPTYFSVYWTGSAVPANSALSLATHQTAGVMATVPLGAGAGLGQFTIRNSAGATAFAVDLQGWFGAP